MPLAGTVPLHPSLPAGGDAGEPVAAGGGELAPVFAGLAERVVTELAPVVPMAGCSARLLARVEEAVRAGS